MSVWGSEWGLGICMSSNFPGNADAAGPGSSNLGRADMGTWVHGKSHLEGSLKKEQE